MARSPLSLKAGLLITLIIIVVAGVAFRQTLGAGLGRWLVVDQPPQKADAIVVLAGGWGGGREVWGAELYRRGFSDTVIVTGGEVGWKTSIASLMKNHLISLGVPAAAIVMEEKATSTVENAQFVKPILKKRAAASILLVTSAYHSRRAANTFRHVLDPDGIVVISCATHEGFHLEEWWGHPRLRKAVVMEYGKFIWNSLQGSLSWPRLVSSRP